MPRGVNTQDEGRIQGRNVVNANSSNIVAPGIVTDGLVLHLDAGNYNSYPIAGTTWYDLSGYRNNGTLVAGAVYSRDGGGSIVFDGTSDAVTSVTTIPPAGNVSVFCWVYATTLNPEWNIIVTKWFDPDGFDFHFALKRKTVKTYSYIRITRKQITFCLGRI